MPFTIIKSDITKMETDAIVNAANSRLLAGGGVCGAIFSAAGYTELQDACDEIGYCKTGDAVITKGFKLKAKYIIHTVGPIYGEAPEKEEKQLYSCYAKSLGLAKENGLTSISFPLISSGIYGYPKAEAIKIAISAIKDFLAENEMDIYLVIYDAGSFEISGKLFGEVRSYIEENLTETDSECGTGLTEEKIAADHLSEVCRNVYRARTPFTVAGVVGIEEKKSLDELIKEKNETFSEMMLRLIDEKGLTDVEVYKRANIDRKLFSKMRKKDYVPKKTTVMAITIALELDMTGAEELLCRAGFAFSKARKLDVIVGYFIEHGIYDIFEINETLFAFGEQLLGA